MGDKEAEDGLTNHLRNELTRVKENFIEIATREEIKWRQKARIKWLQEGDYNTKFFQSSTDTQRITNRILAVNINRSLFKDRSRI